MVALFKGIWILRKLLLVVVVLLVVTGLYFKYERTQKELETLKSNPGALVQDEAKELIDKVSALTDLPVGEEPTVASITDVEKLKGQNFFVNAQNGDKIIIYPLSKRAVLYRPSTNKVIEAGSVAIGNAGLGVSGADGGGLSDGESQVIRLSVINGRNEDVTASVVAGLEGVMDFEVVERKNANSIYERTLVVDLSGGLGEEVGRIASAIGGEVSALPEGETAADVDVVIVVGEDY